MTRFVTVFVNSLDDLSNHCIITQGPIRTRTAARTVINSARAHVMTIFRTATAISKECVQSF